MAEKSESDVKTYIERDLDLKTVNDQIRDEKLRLRRIKHELAYLDRMERRKADEWEPITEIAEQDRFTDIVEKIIESILFIVFFPVSLCCILFGFWSDKYDPS